MIGKCLYSDWAMGWETRCRDSNSLCLGNSIFAIINTVIVVRPEGKRPLGRPRSRWEDNIKMHLQELGWGMDWIELAQDRDRWRALVNAVMNLWVP
jgi:hypothetical protein